MADRSKRPPRRPSALLGRIKNREDAERVISDSSLAYFLLAAVLIAIVLFTRTNIWFDAVLYATLGFWLKRMQSPVAAILLLILASVVFVATVLDWPGATVQGRNAILGLFMIWTSARAVEATLKLPRLRDTVPPPNND